MLTLSEFDTLESLESLKYIPSIDLEVLLYFHVQNIHSCILVVYSSIWMNLCKFDILTS